MKKDNDISASLRRIFEANDDFEIRTLHFGENESIEAELFFIDGLVSGESVSRDVIAPLTDGLRFGNAADENAAVRRILHGGVFEYYAKPCGDAKQASCELLCGFCVLVLKKSGAAVAFETKSADKRAINEPTVEKSVKGPKESFTENLRTNTALLRKKLRNHTVRVEEFSLGDISRTKTALIYIDGVTEPEMVAQTRSRLQTLRGEAVLSAAELEENLSENYKTPFPQLIATERPDKLAIGLLEGRVGVIADGLPFAYMAPANFTEFFRVPEDNAGHFIIASALTILRYIALIISVFMPAVFVAAEMYHQEMIPTKLMLSIIENKQSVPFSTAAEILGMLVIFEILQEAGIRLPQSVGQTVSIIGGLVVGQSAVEAKVVSPIVVIVVALAGITGYTAPNQEMAAVVRLCRMAAVLLALATGVYGVMLGTIALIYHLCSLENLGVAYMAPLVGGGAMRAAREFLRAPIKLSRRRKPYLHVEHEVKGR